MINKYLNKMDDEENVMQFEPEDYFVVQFQQIQLMAAQIIQSRDMFFNMKEYTDQQLGDAKKFLKHVSAYTNAVTNIYISTITTERTNRRAEKAGNTWCPRDIGCVAWKFVDPIDKNTKEECAICTLDYAKGDHMARLPCGHVYHLNCIRQNRDNLCPTCRNPYN
jgi:hypothetical protein